MSQRNQVMLPATGLMVFVNDDNTFYYYANSAWNPVYGATHQDGDWTLSGNNIYSAVTGNVGIGVDNPQQQLDISKSFQFPVTINNATGIIFKGASRFIHDFQPSGAVGYNTFIGRNAGNFTMTGAGNNASYNTSLGAFSLSSITSGNRNSGVGYYSLFANSNGTYNTASGFEALRNNTSGIGNTAIGAEAMQNNISGTGNTVIGLEASAGNTSGNYNTVIGAEADMNNENGSNNTMIGFMAGYGTGIHDKSGNVFLGHKAGYFETGNDRLYIDNSDTESPLIGGNFETDEVYIHGRLGIKENSPERELEINGSLEIPVTVDETAGVIYKGGFSFLHDYKAPSLGSVGQNTFIGKNAGNFTMPGGNIWNSSDNTGIGTSSLHNLTNGYANTAVGSYAMPSVSSGFENTGIGLYALFAASTGNRNSGLGAYSLKENTSGNYNVAVGFDANRYNQNGSNNTIIGYSAGRGSSLHNKSGNVFIGYNAGYNETGSNKLYIENSNSGNPLIGGDFSTDKVYFNAKVGIGTSNPVEELQVIGSIIMQDGNQAANKILISDTDGKASWSSITAVDNDWTVSGNNMFSAVSGSVGIGASNPAASAKLDISATDKGFLPPRMTAAQRTAITSPATGLLVYQTDSPKGFYYYTGTSWEGLADYGANSACIDYDGNSYKTVIIGNSEWMAENLRVTHFNDGYGIAYTTNSTDWANATYPAYCWYNNDEVSNSKFGVIYNWYTVNSTHNICPVGWHVPTYAEWNALELFLGGVNSAGGKMKSLTGLWQSPNTDATDVSGLGALPGGFRTGTGPFSSLNLNSNQWSSTANTGNPGTAYLVTLKYNNGVITYNSYGYQVGCYTRCVRD